MQGYFGDHLEKYSSPGTVAATREAWAGRLPSPARLSIIGSAIRYHHYRGTRLLPPKYIFEDKLSRERGTRALGQLWAALYHA